MKDPEGNRCSQKEILSPSLNERWKVYAILCEKITDCWKEHTIKLEEEIKLLSDRLRMQEAHNCGIICVLHNNIINLSKLSGNNCENIEINQIENHPVYRYGFNYFIENGSKVEIHNGFHIFPCPFHMDKTPSWRLPDDF